VGMHISVLKINLCTDIFVSLTEGMQYYWMLQFECHLISCYILQKSQPKTNWARFQLNWSWPHFQKIVCLLSKICCYKLITFVRYTVSLPLTLSHITVAISGHHPYLGISYVFVP
jgi:hypothetical protein